MIMFTVILISIVSKLLCIIFLIRALGLQSLPVAFGVDTGTL